MQVEKRVTKMESAVKLTFEDAIEWLEQHNPIVAEAIKNEASKWSRQHTAFKLPEDITLEEATKIYLEKLKSIN